MIAIPETHRVLVVDDEPDIFAMTKLSLRKLRYNDHPVELIHCSSGTEAVEFVRQHPDTSVILLDVVMESETAGLDACRAIRGELGNRLVRILLRTGQPGVAPEKKAIDEYDIDGYLLKTELTTTRLYAAVRTAIKAYEELVELQRHRELLGFVHESACQLRAFDTVDFAMQKILAAAATITGARLSVMSLRTFDELGDPRQCLLHLSDDDSGAERAAAIAERVQADVSIGTGREPIDWEEGLLIPLVLHRELGDGWVYLEGGQFDSFVRLVLPVLAAHAGNALYAAVAQHILEEREGPFYNSMGV
jgi:CheY-like chemotaxis protein